MVVLTCRQYTSLLEGVERIHLRRINRYYATIYNNVSTRIALRYSIKYDGFIKNVLKFIEFLTRLDS